jgi:hypothetical protein
VAAFPSWLPQRSSVKALTRDAANFYVGAEGRGTGIFDGRIAGRLSDDEMVGKDTCLGATQAVVAHNGVLYSGSHAHDCSETPGGFPAETERQHFLAQSVSNRHILHWFPDTNGGIGAERTAGAGDGERDPLGRWRVHHGQRPAAAGPDALRGRSRHRSARGPSAAEGRGRSSWPRHAHLAGGLGPGRRGAEVPDLPGRPPRGHPDAAVRPVGPPHHDVHRGRRRRFPPPLRDRRHRR